MKDLQRISAWVCAALLVITGAAAILSFNVERGAFSADKYRQAFERQDLYARMPGILAEALQTTIAGDPNADPFLKVLTVADWQAGIADVLPPQELKSLADDALVSVFAYLNNETDSAAVSLAPLKTRLAGPQGMQAVLRVVNAQPDCTLEQLLQMGAGFFSGDIALCKPPDEMMGLVTPLIESELQFLTAAIPDQVTLVSAPNSDSSADPRARLNGVRLVMKWAPLLPILLLAALTLLAVRSVSDWLNWWGVPFLLSGTATVVVALLGAPILGAAIRSVIQSQGGGLLPAVLSPLLGETVSAVASQILDPAVVQGAGLGAAGLAMVAVAWFLKRRGVVQTG